MFSREKRKYPQNPGPADQSEGLPVTSLRQSAFLLVVMVEQTLIQWSVDWSVRDPPRNRGTLLCVLAIWLKYGLGIPPDLTDERTDSMTQSVQMSGKVC